MDTQGQTPVAAGSPPDVTPSPEPNHSTKTTADKAGETIKALFKGEIKATEAVSISRMFDQMMTRRVGTKEIEKVAKQMAFHNDNKRGKVLGNNIEGGGLVTIIPFLMSQPLGPREKSTLREKLKGLVP